MKKFSKKILSIFLAVLMVVSVLPTGGFIAYSGTVNSDKYDEILANVKDQISDQDYSQIYKLIYGGNNIKLATTGSKGKYADVYAGEKFSSIYDGTPIYLYDSSKKKEISTGGWQCFAYARYAYYTIKGTITDKNQISKKKFSSDSELKKVIEDFATPGTLIRVNKSDNSIGAQHSVLFLTEGKSKKGFYCLEGGHWKGGNQEYSRIGYYSWNLWRKTYGNAISYMYHGCTKDNTINYKITTQESTDITNNSAQINCKISPEMNVQAIGLFYSTDENDINKITVNTPRDDGGNHIWYYLYENANGTKMSGYSFNTAKNVTQNKYTIRFSPGKTYYYNLVFKTNGKWYISDKGRFTTKKDAPKEVTNLRLETTDASLNDSVWVRWDAVQGADKYRVSVEDSDGNIVLYETTTNCTYTIPKRNTADTYTVYVRAENDAGVSKYTPISYEVHENSTVTFKTGIISMGREQVQTKSVLYNSGVVTPPAPSRTGYTFKGWNDNGKLYSEKTTIPNIKSSKNIVASWTPNKYTLKIMDSVSNDLIKEVKVDFDSTVLMSQYSDLAPIHKNYEFTGWSESKIIINKPETYTVYARYKWNSDFRINTEIQSVNRAKSQVSLQNTDGYDINVKVSSPSIANSGIDSTVKGRVIIVLKTKAGRILIESESTAFVLYPDQNNEVSKSLNVFVPYEASKSDDLAYSVEAYVVNKYSSAGTISDVDIDTSKIAIANSEDWHFSTEKPEVGKNEVIATDSAQDYSIYDYTVLKTTTSQGLDSSMNGYSLTSSFWAQTENGFIKYVNSWPTLGSGYGAQFNNTTTVGGNVYREYGGTPKVAGESGNTRIRTEGGQLGNIYYHWCSDSNRGKYYGVTRSNWTSPSTGYKYNKFHCHYLNVNDGVLQRKYVSSIEDNVFERDLRYMSPIDIRDQCLNSMYWVENIPVYYQYWYKDVKINTFTKNEKVTGSTKNSAEIPKSYTDSSTMVQDGITLYTTVATSVSTKETKYYAYKTESKVSHQDKNQYDINVNVNNDYAGKKVLLYVYKYNQLSDYTIEYVDEVTVGENGSINIANAQMREECSQETGDFTIAISLPTETNSIVVGTIEAPKPKYTVEFVAPTSETNADGTIKYVTISTQTVEEGSNANVPDESLVPVRQGYHFVCWNNTTTNVSSDIKVEAVYEQNTYAVSFVDWENKTISQQTCKYGELFTLPELPETNEGMTAEWIIGDGNSDEVVLAKDFLDSGNTVTENMVISVRYTIKSCGVTVLDQELGDMVDDSEISLEQAIGESDVQHDELEYGDIIQLNDYIDEKEDIIFIGWKNAITGEYLDDIEIKEDMIIYPVYYFAETVEAPEANVSTGEYASNQTVTLSCATENAVIFYTTDGSDPETSETAIEYTAPINLTKSCTLHFCAMALGMNNSGTVVENYAINTSTSGVRYHIVTVYSNLPYQEGECYQSLIKEGTRLDDSIFKNVVGYTFDGLFYDEELTDEFSVSAETVEESLELFAGYTPKQYTATFVDDDGTLLEKVTVNYGELAEYPIPFKENYVFVGWDSYDFECMTENKTFIAKYCLESEYVRVSFSRTSRTAIVDTSITLKPTITPSSEDVKLIWNSSDWSVAEVDNYGNVNMVSAGSAVITVTVESTGESASCIITVREDTDKKIVLSNGSLLGFDSLGYLRGVPDKANTVSELRNQFINDNVTFFGINNGELSDDENVGTGSTIRIMDGDTIIDSITFIMTGDLSYDGLINNRDVAMINKALVDKQDLNECQQISGDVNGDGVVNNRDAAMLARYLVGKETLK